jgi:hypothetical protein
MFCGSTADVVLWVIEDDDDPVPACRSCAERQGLSIRCGRPDAGDMLDNDVCRCCGRELPSPRSRPMTVWVRDRRRLMAVCNACRAEYALQAVFTSAAPVGRQVRREAEPPHGGLEASPSD